MGLVQSVMGVRDSVKESTTEEEKKPKNSIEREEEEKNENNEGETPRMKNKVWTNPPFWL